MRKKENFKITNLSQGISLIITFFIMIIALAMVLGLSAIMTFAIKTTSNTSYAVQSFQSAQSGIEKTLYYDRKQISAGASRGICNICNSCTASDCQSCTITPLAAGGCDVNTCNNCTISYTSTVGGRSYAVSTTVTPDLCSNINSIGSFSSTVNVSRASNYNIRSQ